MTSPRSGVARALFALLLAVAWVVAARGQPLTGRLRGTVRSEAGDAISAARIVLREPDTGDRHERVTDVDGRFSFPALRPGLYVLAVHADGYSELEHDELPVEADHTADLDIVLRTGSANEVVFSRGRTSPLTRSDAGTLRLLDEVAIGRTPLATRDVVDLTALLERTSAAPEASRGTGFAQAGAPPVVGGQRPDHLGYRLDAAPVNDPLTGQAALSPPLESLRELSLQQSLPEARAGDGSAGRLDLLTRSGTDSFHAGLAAELRDEVFDARGYFDGAEPAAVDRHRVALSIGGPLRRDRSFFFAAADSERGERAPGRLSSVPPAALRSGDFSGLPALCDPLARDVATGSCSPFPGNRIPPDRLDPVAQALLASVPLPNVEDDVLNLRTHENEHSDHDSWTLRLDHRFGDGIDSLLRYTSFAGDDFEPIALDELAQPLLPGFGRRLESRTTSLSAGATLVLGRRWLDQVRFAWLDVSGGDSGENNGVDFAVATGLAGVSRDPRDGGFPQVSTAGLYDSFGDASTYVQRRGRQVEIFDRAVAMLGSHQVEAGVRWLDLELDTRLAEAARGSFYFDGHWTGNAFADFLLGYPTRARAGRGEGDERGRMRRLHAFVQDEWQATSHFTLDFGIRWENNRQMTSADNRLASLDLVGGRWVIASDPSGRVDDSAAARLADIPLPWVPSAAIGWDRSLVRSDTRLAPRVGFAWTLDDPARTVLRGGYAMVVHAWPQGEQTRLARNLPFFELREIDASADEVPALTTADILLADRDGAVVAAILDPDFSAEYTQTFELGLQRMVSRRTRFDARWTHARTLHAERTTFANVPEPASGEIASRRPLPELAAVRVVRFDGRAEYDAFTAEVDRRFDAGFAFRASYTWSQAFDDASDVGATAAESNLPNDVHQRPRELAPASYDHRHRLAASGTLTLPFLRQAGGWKEALGANWRISGLLVWETGAPFTVALYGDPANIGSGPVQRPDLLTDPGGGGNAEAWFDPGAFTEPAALSFGNAPRNGLRGPDSLRFDLSFAKIVHLPARREIEVRIDVFNVLNHTNLGVPGRFASTPDFARMRTAGEPRQLQLGTRLRL